jgi:hypothetical protein
VLVVRTKDGTLRGHYDVCRHRGSRLAAPGRRANVGGLRARPPHAPRRRPAHRAARRHPRAPSQLPARGPTHGRAHHLRSGGELESDRRELQRVPPLRTGAPGAVRGRTRVQATGWEGPRLARRVRLPVPDEMVRPSLDPGDAVGFWDLVDRQDSRICESVQQGMGSRAFNVGYCAPMEDLSLDIRRYLGERLGRQVPPVEPRASARSKIPTASTTSEPR